MDKRWEGITFFRRKSLSQCRKISWETLQCFKKFRVSKNFMHKKGISPFSAKQFVLEPKKIDGGPFCVSKKFWYRKFSCIGEGRGHHGFLEKFLSHGTEKLCTGSLLCFRKFLAWKQIMEKRWGASRFSVENSQCRKISWGNLSIVLKEIDFEYRQ